MFGVIVTETKEKILLKALQYFTENDYEGASLEKIAGAIGITKGGSTTILRVRMSFFVNV